MQIRHGVLAVLLAVLFISSVPAASEEITLQDNPGRSLADVISSAVGEHIGSETICWVSYELKVRESMLEMEVSFDLNGTHYISSRGHRDSGEGIEWNPSAEKLLLLKFRKNDSGEASAIRVVDRSEPISFSAPSIRIADVSAARSFSYVKEMLEKKSGEARNVYLALIALHPDNRAQETLLAEYEKSGGEGYRKSALFWYSNTLEGEDLGELPRLQEKAKGTELRKHFAFIYHNTNSKAGFSRLVEMVKTEEREVAEQAVFWIGQSDREEGLKILFDLYEERSEDDLREKVIFAISQHDSKQAAEYLKRIARSDTNPEMREKAIFWLSQRDEESLPLLVELYDAESSEKTREKIMFSISQVDTRAAIDVLEKIAREEDSVNLRKKAIFWIGQHDDESRAFEVISGLFAGETSAELKENMLFSIGQIEVPKAAAFLAAIAEKGEEERLREKALFWLVQRDDAAPAIDLLTSMYAREKSQEMKEKIIFNLYRLETREAISKLAEIAKTESNIDLRKKALFWLSQTDSDEAVEYLESTILQ